jgi:hypothetical protein
VLVREIGLDGKLTDWLARISADCPRRKAASFADWCGVRCPDLLKLARRRWRRAPEGWPVAHEASFCRPRPAVLPSLALFAASTALSLWDLRAKAGKATLRSCSYFDTTRSLEVQLFVLTLVLMTKSNRVITKRQGPPATGNGSL